METTIVHWGYTRVIWGHMENKMETTLWGSRFRKELGWRSLVPEQLRNDAVG